MQLSTGISTAFSSCDDYPADANEGTQPVHCTTPHIRALECPPSLRRSRSFSDHDAQGRDTPTLSTLLGKRISRNLDACFGSLQPPCPGSTGATFNPWELDDKGLLRKHPCLALVGEGQGAFSHTVSVETQHAALESAVDLAALMADTKRYIWAVGRTGRIIIGESIGESRPGSHAEDGGITPAMLDYSGHAMLVGGNAARVAGELHYDSEHHRLVVYDRSGRYSQYSDRGPAQIEQVAMTLKSVFAISGLDVVPRKKIAHRPLKSLVYPNLALSDGMVDNAAPVAIPPRHRRYSGSDVPAVTGGTREAPKTSSTALA